MDEELTLSEIYGEELKFNHTLEGWILPKYEKFYSQEYAVNHSYLHEHIDELLELPDVIVPRMGILLIDKEKWNKRHAIDVGYDTPTGEHGIYA